MGNSFNYKVCILFRKSIAKRVLKVAFIGKCSMDLIVKQ